jgi:hypothetical protein
MAATVAIDPTQERFAEIGRRLLDALGVRDATQSAYWLRVREESERKLDAALIELVDVIVFARLEVSSRDEAAFRNLDLLCDCLRIAGRLPMDRLSSYLVGQIRTLIVAHPELEARLPSDLADAVYTVRIPPLAYLRSMWSLFWSAIRHPLSDTTIDLSTGRVLYRTAS